MFEQNGITILTDNNEIKSIRKFLKDLKAESVDYTIVNDSEGITANLAASSVTTNSNSEYFTVTTSRDASTLAPGASTTETVTVVISYAAGSAQADRCCKWRENDQYTNK